MLSCLLGVTLLFLGGCCNCQKSFVSERSLCLSQSCIALHNIIMAVALLYIHQGEIITLKQDIVCGPLQNCNEACSPLCSVFYYYECNKNKVMALWQMVFIMKFQLFLVIKVSGHGAKYYANSPEVWYLDYALSCSMEVSKCFQQWKGWVLYFWFNQV